MNVEIDKNSGYCFGVEFAIKMAEDELLDSESLYCLGDIVHNTMEVRRLEEKGLKIISKEDLPNINDCKVLIRAHGEPPETYKIAIENNIELIDASCPVVLKLQNRIKYDFDKIKAKNGQIVIYGQHGHAEVIGLAGQTNNEAIIVCNEQELDKIDFDRPITLYSQTTKSTKGFYKIRDIIRTRIKSDLIEVDPSFYDANDSICRQVSNREPQLIEFSQKHDVVVFVSGKKSSNGKALYQVCKSNNNRSYFVENEVEVDADWFKQTDNVGICGATSTPMWLMENVLNKIKKLNKNLLNCNK